MSVIEVLLKWCLKVLYSAKYDEDLFVAFDAIVVC